MKRELCIRWVLIEHTKWFDKMVDDVFGSKTLMRHTLSLKQTMYNSWTSYAKAMKLSFQELRQFWRYLDDHSGNTFLKMSQKDTKEGRLLKRKIERKLAAYKTTGPIGSSDPIQPIDTAHLHSMLNLPNGDLSERWKKTNIEVLNKKLNCAEKEFRPSNRASSLLYRTRIPGDRCIKCTSARTDALASLLPFRVEVKRMFKELFGVDYGMTIGIFYAEGSSLPPEWFDVILVINKPERLLALPVYTTETVQIQSSKIGGEIAIPVAAKVDTDDVFDGRSLCLIEHFMKVDDGHFARPAHLAFVVKSGIKSTPSGWVCEYLHQCKVSTLDYAKCKVKATILPKQVKMFTMEPQLERELNESDFGDNDDVDWGESEVSEEEPTPDNDADENQTLAVVKIDEDDRKDISKKVANFIDVSKYYVCTSAKRNHVQVLWKDREKRSIGASTNARRRLYGKTQQTQALFTQVARSGYLSTAGGRNAPSRHRRGNNGTALGSMTKKCDRANELPIHRIKVISNYCYS